MAKGKLVNESDIRAELAGMYDASANIVQIIRRIENGHIGEFKDARAVGDDAIVIAGRLIDLAMKMSLVAQIKEQDVRIAAQMADIEKLKSGASEWKRMYGRGSNAAEAGL